MIIWRGRGIAIALIAFACLLVSEFATEAALGDGTYYQAHGWPKLAGFWLAAAVIYKMQSWFGVGKTRGFVDPNIRRDIRPSAEGELFFVPARFWPHILVILGVIFLFVTG